MRIKFVWENPNREYHFVNEDVDGIIIGYQNGSQNHRLNFLWIVYDTIVGFCGNGNRPTCSENADKYMTT